MSFAKEKAKVSTKIGTEKGVEQYTHLWIACAQHVDVKLPRIRGGVVKYELSLCRK